MVAKKNWKTVFSKRAKEDAKKLNKNHLKPKVEKLLDHIEQDPLKIPPPIKKLLGDFDGYYSRRINIQHRLVYSVHKTDRIIKVISMCHHYDD